MKNTQPKTDNWGLPGMPEKIADSSTNASKPLMGEKISPSRPSVGRGGPKVKNIEPLTDGPME